MASRTFVSVGGRLRLGLARLVLLPALWVASHVLAQTAPTSALLKSANIGTPAEGSPAPKPIDWRERLVKTQAAYERLQSQPTAPAFAERERLLLRLMAQLRQYLEQQRLTQGNLPSGLESPPTLALEGPPPYSVLEVDQLRDKRDQLQARKAALDSSLKHMEQELSGALQALRKADESLRLQSELHERAVASQSPQAVGTLGALEVARLQQELAQLDVARADDARPPQQAQIQAVEAQLGPLNAAIETARQQQRLDERDLQTLERDNVKRLEALEAEQQKAALRLSKLSRASESPWVQRTAAAMEGEIYALGQLVALVRGDSEIWSFRASALQQGQDARAQRDARNAITGALVRIDGRRAAAEEQLRFLQLQLREFQLDAGASDNGSASKAAAAPRQETDRGRALQAVMRQVEVHQRVISHLDHTRLLLQRSLEDFSRQPGQAERGRLSQDIKALVTGWVQRLWQFELFSATETTLVNGRSVTVDYGVTVGKSLGALVLFVAGYLLARRLTQAFVGQLKARMGLSPQLARVIQRWVLSLLVVLVLLVVLRMARVPLTAFAFLGGALAIGIGFGAQNVIKNLISGVIILFERKVRVGDTVTVGNVSGEVIAVDLRATTIRGFDGIEAIIPNSTLLEQLVSNWTSGQPVLRRRIRLMLARDADLAQARQLMVACAQQHPSVLADPAPDVLLEDLQADAAELALYYWLRLDGPRSGPQVDSDVRGQLDRLLRDHQVPLARTRTVVQMLKPFTHAKSAPDIARNLGSATS